MIADAPSGTLLLANKQVEEILRQPFPHAANIEEYTRYKAFHLNKQPFNLKSGRSHVLSPERGGQR